MLAGRVARDDRHIHGVRGKGACLGRAHRGEGQLLKAGDEAGAQYLVLLDHGDPDLAGNRPCANAWPSTGQRAVTPDSQKPDRTSTFAQTGRDHPKTILSRLGCPSIPATDAVTVLDFD
jgi:hypothetical protein